MWLGVFVGLILSLFGRPESTFGLLLFAALWGALFGIVWAAAGYAFTRGQRDFSSVTQVVATRYEVFCEHKFAQQGRDILAEAGLVLDASTGAADRTDADRPLPPPGRLTGGSRAPRGATKPPRDVSSFVEDRHREVSHVHGTTRLVALPHRVGRGVRGSRGRRAAAALCSQPAARAHPAARVTPRRPCPP